jgi:hypothetical protein
LKRNVFNGTQKSALIQDIGDLIACGKKKGIPTAWDAFVIGCMLLTCWK